MKNTLNSLRDVRLDFITPNLEDGGNSARISSHQQKRWATTSMLLAMVLSIMLMASIPSFAR